MLISCLLLSVFLKIILKSHIIRYLQSLECRYISTHTARTVVARTSTSVCYLYSVSSEIVSNSHVVVIQLGGAYVEHILPKHHKVAEQRGFYQPEYPVALVCTFYRFSVCRRSGVVGSAVWTCYEVLQLVTEREVVCYMVFTFEYKYIRRYYIFGFAYYHSRVVLLKQISGVERERFGYFLC